MQELRHRKQGAFSPKPVSMVAYHTNGSSSVSVTSKACGTLTLMDDVVSKPFIPGQTIVNTAMQRTTETIDFTPLTGSQRNTNPNVSGVYLTQGGKYRDRSVDLQMLSEQLSNFDYNSLIMQASTKALAGVKKPDVSGLVGLAEMKSTIASLKNPLGGVLKVLKRNAFSDTRKRKSNNAKRAAKDLADQHLTVIFGIMPFVSDIVGILKVLQEYDPLRTRYTSRGEASSMDAKSTSGSGLIFNDASTTETLFYNDEVQRTVSVRAYILYEASLELHNLLGVSFEDIPKTVWATMSMSFLYDWFVNVGDFISALTPVSGVRYLAQGYTLNVVDTQRSLMRTEVRVKPTAVHGWNGDYVSGSQTRVVVAKRRVPGNLASKVGITLKRNMHQDVLDAYKITAIISLITQRLK